MKRIYKTLLTSVLSIMTISCADLLEVESQTAVTSSFLFESPEGLEKAVIGLYTKDRSFATGESTEYIITMLDYSTDIMVFRGGTAAAFARLDNLKASDSNVKTYWNQNYQIIGKANEIIAAAEKLGLDDPKVKYAYGQALAFRGRAYFNLYIRFERLYLNTEPTTLDNAFGRTFRAAGKDEIFRQIKSDLDAAIGHLDWIPATGVSGLSDYGRITKAVAKHVRAQVAMWEEDWDTAIQHCEDIFACPSYSMLPRTIDVFSDANLRNSEVLYAYQMSANPGGGNSTNNGVVAGHRLSLNTTPNYKKVSGMKNTVEYGGYGWGRVYPNTYLMSLYDQAHDRRYSELFRFKYYYNDADGLPAGKTLGEEVIPSTSNYLESLHFSSFKFFDQWTNADNPERTSSFKDLIVYRLAETYLMAAEAYFHRDGGASAKAIEYFNKTYARAGNPPFSGALTLDDLLDEYARELHFEGVRWPLLKRLGLLGERVRLHAGDSKAEDPKLNTDYTQARQNFRDERDWRWPIPQDELDLMPGFGQNHGWL